MSRQPSKIISVVGAAIELADIPTKAEGPGALNQGLPSGQQALSQESGVVYVLSVSAAAPDGSTVIATKDDPDRRWLAVGGSTPPPSGGVTAVTASPPLASSGGDTPNLTAPGLDGLADYELFSRQAQAFMASLVPELDGFGFVNPTEGTIYVAPDAPPQDAWTYEGGSLTTDNATVLLFGRAITTKPKTGKLAVYAQVKIATPIESRSAKVGLFNYAGTHWINFGTDYGASQTKFVGQLFNGSTWTDVICTTDADANLHTVCLAFDGTTWSFYLDDNETPIGSTADLSNIVEEPMYVGIRNTVRGDIIITRFAYGYVAPV